MPLDHPNGFSLSFPCPSFLQAFPCPASVLKPRYTQSLFQCFSKRTGALLRVSTIVSHWEQVTPVSGRHQATGGGGVYGGPWVRVQQGRHQTHRQVKHAGGATGQKSDLALLGGQRLLLCWRRAGGLRSILLLIRARIGILEYRHCSAFSLILKNTSCCFARIVVIKHLYHRENEKNHYKVDRSCSRSQAARENYEHLVCVFLLYVSVFLSTYPSSFSQLMLF